MLATYARDADRAPAAVKADAPFTIPMPGTSSRKRDVRPYTRGFEDESRPREADRDIAVSARLRPSSVSRKPHAKPMAATRWRGLRDRKC